VILPGAAFSHADVQSSTTSFAEAWLFLGFTHAEHGSPVSRAERKIINLRPSNLIWIMPAQGGKLSHPVPFVGLDLGPSPEMNGRLTT
jgi:hypothetical protein